MKKRRSKADGGDYKVGYGRPPRHSQYKPGQSGYPKGRPRGVRNFKTDVKATLKAPVRVTRDGQPRKVSTQEAMLLRLREKALGGDSRALDRLIQLAQIYNEDELAATAAALPTEDENVLRIYHKRVLSGAAVASDLATNKDQSGERDGSNKPTAQPRLAGTTWRRGSD